MTLKIQLNGINYEQHVDWAGKSIGNPTDEQVMAWAAGEARDMLAALADMAQEAAIALDARELI